MENDANQTREYDTRRVALLDPERFAQAHAKRDQYHRADTQPEYQEDDGREFFENELGKGKVTPPRGNGGETIQQADQPIPMVVVPASGRFGLQLTSREISQYRVLFCTGASSS